jgi:hypothetical protein
VPLIGFGQTPQRLLNQELIEKGTEKEPIYYHHGKLFTGVSFDVYENGQLMIEINYKRGKVHGLYQSWHENGNKRINRNYKEGKIDGLCQIWDKDGLLIYENNFKNGKLEIKNYTGLTLNEVKKEIGYPFVKFIVVDSVFTDSVPKGIVFNQELLEGTFIEEGRLIYITMSRKYQQTFLLHDVYNKSEREAINQLGSYFELEIKRGKNCNPSASVVTMLKVGKKEVFPGDKLIKGTKITVYINNVDRPDKSQPVDEDF